MNPRVLILRDPARAAELLTLLKADGIPAMALAVIRTVFVWKRAELPDLARFHWLAFTSVNGVHGFADALRETAATLPAAIRIAAVGPATAAAVTRTLRTPEIVAAESDARHLAEAIGARSPQVQTALLWPCAAQHGEDFSVPLAAAGFRVQAWPVYATEALPPPQLRAALPPCADVAAAVFAAPSAVNAFVEALPPPWNFVAIAIGPVTARALVRAGVSHIVVSSGTAAADLHNVIIDTISRQPS